MPSRKRPRASSLGFQSDGGCLPSSLHLSKLSHLLFGWVNPIIHSRQKLHLPQELQSRSLYEELLQYESIQLQQHSKSASPLWMNVYHVIAKDFWLGGLYLFINNILLIFNSILIKYILKAVHQQEYELVFKWSLLVFFTSIGEAIFLQQFNHGEIFYEY